MSYNVTLSDLEMNEEFIHSLLDVPCISSNTNSYDEYCIVERLTEILQVRAGLVDSNNDFRTSTILSRDKVKEYYTAHNEAPWNQENSTWGYGSFEIIEEGCLETAVASGLFSGDIRGYSFLCEMLIDKSLENMDIDYITKYINDLDDERFVYEDLYMDLMNDEEDGAESMQMYRDFALDETISLWEEILQAKRHGLTKGSALYSLMDDYSQIFQGYISPEVCFSYIEELMYYTFGLYEGSSRCMTCYSSQEIGNYLKVRGSVGDCFEKRLLEHSLEVIANTSSISSSEYPLSQFSCMDDVTGCFCVIIATADNKHFATLDNRHPFWMYAVILADILAPICVSKASEVCKAA